jgi:hypothetical protein
VKINLRKAAAIQSNILVAIEIVHSSVNINKFSNAIDEVKKTSIESSAKLINNIALYKALYSIRKLVQKASSNANIPDILAEIQFLTKTRSLCENVFLTAVPRPAIEVIEGMKEDLKVAAVSASYQSKLDREVSIGVFTKDTIDTNLKQIKTTTKAIRLLEDKLLDLNVKNEIELDDETVTVLKDSSII